MASRNRTGKASFSRCLLFSTACGKRLKHLLTHVYVWPGAAITRSSCIISPLADSWSISARKDIAISSIRLWVPPEAVPLYSLSLLGEFLHTRSVSDHQGGNAHLDVIAYYVSASRAKAATVEITAATYGCEASALSALCCASCTSHASTVDLALCPLGIW